MLAKVCCSSPSPSSSSSGDDGERVHFLPLDNRVYYAAAGIAAWHAVGGTPRMVVPSDLRFPGAYFRSVASMPATLEYIKGTAKQRIAQLGAKHGCHTCGVKNTAQWIGDHMPPLSVVLKSRKSFLPNLLNLIATQKFLPQCNPCSNRQGMAVLYNRRVTVTHACGGAKRLGSCGSLLSLAGHVEHTDIARRVRGALDETVQTLGAQRPHLSPPTAVRDFAQKWFRKRDEVVRKALSSEKDRDSRAVLRAEQKEIRKKKNSL
mmetsp:Transcript_29513/g.55217  ORF Transcript_29513/g.55217 Transcript_29513/m.55217 type:complete len:262 (-) Transcript_29513:278-1063(-)